MITYLKGGKYTTNFYAYNNQTLEMIDLFYIGGTWNVEFQKFDNASDLNDDFTRSVNQGANIIERKEFDEKMKIFVEKLNNFNKNLNE